MARVKHKDTKPEMVVRRATHAMGYRYRLHRKDLPGKPDLIFPGRKKVIFIHGCFWHGHSCRAGRNRPGSNTEYWIPKLNRNIERDRNNIAKLEQKGWHVLIIWECEIKDEKSLKKKISSFLDG